MKDDGPPTRTYPADEITRDPIFLFQSRRYIWLEANDYHWSEEHERVVDDDGSVVTDEQAVADGTAVKTWETELVFFTREEGENYGKSHAYNYTAGWRVYCVCAQGELAALLGSVTVKP